MVMLADGIRVFDPRCVFPDQATSRNVARPNRIILLRLVSQVLGDVLAVGQSRVIRVGVFLDALQFPGQVVDGEPISISQDFFSVEGKYTVGKGGVDWRPVQGKPPWIF